MSLAGEFPGPSAASSYPARLQIDYPEDELDRLTSAFRPLLAIPIVVVAASVVGDLTYREGDAPIESARTVISTGGFLFLPALLKWLLAFPHYVVILLLGVVTFVVVIFAWFAILVTGRYPREIFDFVVGGSRWTWRVHAYAILLATDRYPPFSLEP